MRCRKQIAQVLDRCDSILNGNNDILNHKIKSEKINLSILKFINFSLENTLFFKLFHSREFITFIIDTSDDF